MGYCGTVPFISTWQTTTVNENITIPTSGGGYDYTVVWGDGTLDTNVVGNITHTYATPGQYQIEITGDFPRIFFNNIGDITKIRSIDQWGDNQWSSMANAFEGCNFLMGNYTDIPDLSLVRDMSAMFRLAERFNSPVNDWDVSGVTNMSQLFENATLFNQPLNNWKVDMVTNMSFMFNNFNDGTVVEIRTPIPGTDFFNLTREVVVTASFNQDISSWDVSNVTNMSNMFAATPFNQNIGGWNVSNVTDMSAMFQFAIAFNQNLNDWNVSNVTQMPLMFSDAQNFNGDISIWDVSMVTNMSEMFYHASSFNTDISAWEVGMVTDMSFMFGATQLFNADITEWDVSMVTNMSGMFTNTVVFNQPIGTWDVSNVENMSGMFFDAMVFNQNINAWDTGSVTAMNAMFAYALEFNQPLDNWDVSMVTNMDFMFFDAQSFDQNIGDWEVISLETAVEIFQGVDLSVENYDALLIGWEANAVGMDVVIGAGGNQFCAGEAARERLIQEHNWSFTNDSKVSFILNTLANQEAEYVYTFPSISGTGLTGNQAYYTEPDGAGETFLVGEQLFFDADTLYPITIYMYDQTDAIHPCSTQSEFQLTLTQCGSAFTPSLNSVNPITREHSFTFPVIAGVNLSGRASYYLESDALGRQFLEGETVFFEDFTTYPVTIYVYDEIDPGFGYVCNSQQQFALTITETQPECTNLVSPLDNAFAVQVDSDFIEWEPIFNASGYEVSIGTSPNGNEIVNAFMVENTFFSLEEALPTASEIFVSIIPFNSVGRAIGCSLQSFTTEVTIEIPKFFTPNNDGINDVLLFPNPLQTLESYFIYDRFGKLLFQSVDPEQGWNGEFNGKQMPTDSYWYKALYAIEGDYRGNVMLKR